jgi:hypothetical protein
VKTSKIRAFIFGIILTIDYWKLNKNNENEDTLDKGLFYSKVICIEFLKST